MNWPWSRSARDVPAYVDTPAGILSVGGVRYRTTQALLDEYAGAVFEKVPLGTLLRQAEAWLASASAVASLLLLTLLFVVPWFVALGLALVLYAIWAVATPGMSGPRGAPVLRWLGHPIVQGVLFVLGLSVLAASGRTTATWVGIAGFIGFRLGLVGWLLRSALTPIVRRLYPLPAPDQTLRSIILKTALRYGIQLDGMAEIERDVRSFWQRPRG